MPRPDSQPVRLLGATAIEADPAWISSRTRRPPARRPASWSSTSSLAVILIILLGLRRRSRRVLAFAGAERGPARRCIPWSVSGTRTCSGWWPWGRSALIARRQPVQDRLAGRRRAHAWPSCWAAGCFAPDHRPRRAADPERRRGDGHRLRHAGAAGLPARERGRDQRLRRRPHAGRRRHRASPAACIQAAHARRAARGHRPRVQPHLERRHAAQHPADGRALRHPRDRHDRLDHLPSSIGGGYVRMERRDDDDRKGFNPSP